MALQKRSVTALMKAMGSKNGEWDGLPTQQHQWQSGAGEDPLHREWSWMVAHTCHWARGEYAMDENGHELHIENMAEDLGMSVAFAYRVWRDGVQRGLWRNGTKAEGPRRLYFNAIIKPLEKSEEKENGNVCTDFLPGPILKQIKDWPKEKQAALLELWRVRQNARDVALADAVDIVRDVCDEQDDAALQGMGLEPSRNKPHKKNGIPPELAEALTQARHARQAPLAPIVSRLVQTSLDFVRTPEFAMYKALQENAQTPATLLPQTPSRAVPDLRASGHSDAPGAPVRTAALDGERVRKQLPAAQLPELSGSEKEAEDLLFEEVRRMQQAYPHTDFSSELISRHNRGDQVWARAVLEFVGADNMTQFLLSVAAKFKGLDRNSFGKLPSRAPGQPKGPRSLGLIWRWAQDYGCKLADAAREHMEISAQRRRDEIRVCTEILRDPEAQEKNKIYARELLRSHGVSTGGFRAAAVGTEGQAESGE